MLRTVGQIIGFAASAAMIFSFQLKKQKTLVMFWLISSVLFVTHYGMLGEWSGMAMESVLLLRNLLQYSQKPWVSKKWVLYLLLVLIAGLTALLWKNIFSLFPAIALTVSTLSLWTNDIIKIKKAQLLGTSPAWMVYNIRIGSWAGILCEALDMGSVVLYFFRARREKKVTV